MRLRLTIAGLLTLGLSACAPATPASAPSSPTAPSQASQPQSSPLAARIVAVGIPGVNAVAPVGVFHPGGPIHDNATLAAYTQTGRVLDPNRILVASSSNFGAPRARADQPEGGALSLDPSGADTLVVPSHFASAGGQASALDGRVQLFTAQSPAFLNGLTTPAAATADQPSVSNPQGISINNAFGRIWFPNIPMGLSGYGTESIIDPDGRPLANAPDATSGGVFAGNLTGRTEQKVTGGLDSAAIGNALLGPSPDGSKRAVFAVVTANGSLIQAHAGQGVDGLAPAGTVHPVVSNSPTRAGMLFNWTPDRILYATEAGSNSIAVVPLQDDGAVFHPGTPQHLTAPQLSTPIDMTPAVPEVANPQFSSNTSLAGGSDIFVANNGNGTIVRMTQAGKVLAVRSVQIAGAGDIGAGRIQGIAASSDATKLWITVSGAVPGYPDAPGAVLEVAAFSASSPAASGSGAAY